MCFPFSVPYFPLYDPEPLSHMGTSSVLERTPGDPEICLLPVRFSKNYGQQNFYILVSLNLEVKEVFSTIARLKILLGKTRCCMEDVKCWITNYLLGAKSKDLGLPLDHCLLSEADVKFSP